MASNTIVARKGQNVIQRLADFNMRHLEDMSISQMSDNDHTLVLMIDGYELLKKLLRVVVDVENEIL